MDETEILEMLLEGRWLARHIAAWNLVDIHGHTPVANSKAEIDYVLYCLEYLALPLRDST